RPALATPRARPSAEGATPPASPARAYPGSHDPSRLHPTPAALARATIRSPGLGSLRHTAAGPLNAYRRRAARGEPPGEAAGDQADRTQDHHVPCPARGLPKEALAEEE